MSVKDLVADFGGVGNGQRTSVTGSIASGTNVFTPGTDIFSSGDIGKAIFIRSGSFLHPSNETVVKITAYNSGTHAITLDTNAGSTISGATCDVLWGTDNTDALTGATGSYIAWAQSLGATQANLTIPAGRYCANLGPFHPLNFGVQNSLISGPLNNADSCILSMLTSPEMRLGGDPPVPVNKGLTNVSGISARLNSTTAGATTATLVDKAGYGSRITVGAYCFVSGYDMQSVGAGTFGYPPNPFFYETNVITGYNGATGTITFQNPLKYAYQSDWPSWSSSSTDPDQGGPATIYVLSDFNRVVELNDVTLDHPQAQISCHGRSVILRRVKHTVWGVYPTQNTTYEAYDSTFPVNHEVDKMNGTVLFSGCDLNIIQVQSASPDVLTITGGTLKHITGSPKKLVMTDVVMQGSTGSGERQIQVGCGYGRTDEVILTGITNLDAFGPGTSTNSGIHGGGFCATMPLTSGVFKFLKTDNDGVSQENPGLNLVPGTWLALDNKLYFQVTRVWEDGTYVYHQTNLPGSWPFTGTSAVPHPAPRFTMTGCSGLVPEIEDYASAAPAIPLYSYSKRTYVNGSGTNTTPFSLVQLRGQLRTAKFNVTSTGASTFHESQFDNWDAIYKANYTTYTLAPTINMATSGQRIINGAAPATNAQSGDSLPDLTSIGQIWFQGQSNSGPIFSANNTGATLTVEFTMDQGIPATTNMTYRPRIRFI
jgi:hypothetical protein